MYGLAVEILIEQHKSKARSDGLVSWKNSKKKGNIGWREVTKIDE